MTKIKIQDLLPDDVHKVRYHPLLEFMEHNEVAQSLNPNVDISESLQDKDLPTYVYKFLVVNNITLSENNTQIVRSIDQVKSVTFSIDFKIKRAIYRRYIKFRLVHAISMFYKMFGKRESNKIKITGHPAFVKNRDMWLCVCSFSVLIIFMIYIINFRILFKDIDQEGNTKTNRLLVLLSLFVVYNFICVTKSLLVSVSLNLVFMPDFWYSLITFVTLVVTFNSGLFICTILSLISIPMNLILYPFTLLYVLVVLHQMSSELASGLTLLQVYIYLLSPIHLIIEPYAILEEMQLVKHFLHNDTQVNLLFSNLQNSLKNLIIANFIFWFVAIIILYFVFFLNVQRKLFKKFFVTEEPQDLHKEEYDYVTEDIRSEETKSSHMFTDQSSQFVGAECLAINLLNKTFKVDHEYVTVLKKCNIRANDKSITAIYGPHGCGKSTLVKIIAGKMSADCGTMKLFQAENKDINCWDDRKEIVTFLPEESILYDFLTFREYLCFIYLKNRTVVPDNFDHNINEICVKAGVEFYLPNLVKNCTDAVKRIMQIIGLFLLDSTIVVLDDPYMKLDFCYRLKLNNIFKYRKSMQSIILTTNNLLDVETLADSILLMISGRSIFQSDTKCIRLKNKLGFRLICYLQPYITDYNLIMYIKNRYPMINYELTSKDIVQFNVPNVLRDTDALLNELEEKKNKLGLRKVHMSNVDFQLFFEQIIYKFLNSSLAYSKKYNAVYSKIGTDDIVNQRKKYFYQYAVQFAIFVVVCIRSMCRFPNSITFYFIVPFISYVAFFIANYSINKNIVFIKQDFNYGNHLIVGYENNLKQHAKIEQILSNYWKGVRYINNVSFHYFCQIIRKEKIFHTTLYVDDTDYVIMSNIGKDVSYLYFQINNYFIGSLDISIASLKRPKFKGYHVSRCIILYLMLSLLTIVSAYIHTNYMTFNYDESMKTLRIAFLHYTIPLLANLFIKCNVMVLSSCLYILIILLTGDLLIVAPGIETQNLLIFEIFLFNLSDLALKTFIGSIFNFSFRIFYVMMLIDNFGIYLCAMVETIELQNKILKNGLYSLNYCVNKDIILMMMTFLLPSINLRYVIVAINQYGNKFPGQIACSIFQKSYLGISIPEIKSYSTSIFLFQFFLYMILTFLYNHPIHFYISGKIKIIIERIKKKIRSFRRQVTFEMSNKNDSDLMINKQEALIDEDLFTFSNVSYIENNVKVLTNFNWAIKRHKVNLILGSNSCGKTIILNLLLGYKQPSAGKIFYQKKLMKHLEISRENDTISFFSDMKQGIQTLTVRELFNFFCKLRNVKDDKISALCKKYLKDFEISKAYNTIIADLSDAMHCKVLVLMSIIGFPNVVLLDDPLKRLDYFSQRKIINFIYYIKHFKSTIVLTASDMGDFYNLVDYVLVLDRKNPPFSSSISEFKCPARLGYFITFLFSFDIRDTEREKNRLIKKLMEKFDNVEFLSISETDAMFYIPIEKLQNNKKTKITLTLDFLFKADEIILRFLVSVRYLSDDKLV